MTCTRRFERSERGAVTAKKTGIAKTGLRRQERTIAKILRLAAQDDMEAAQEDMRIGSG